MEYLEILRQVELFREIEPEELLSMLGCLQARTASYKKGEMPLVAGTRPEHIGVVLTGQLHIVREDVDGHRTLLTTLAPSDIFAESLCCAEVAESPVSAVADTDVDVLQLRFTRILRTCPSSCRFHQTLIANMLRLVAKKNLYLQNRLELVRTRSVRTKVLGYLGQFGAKRGEPFAIPLNREEMADYLCVERSALSHELMRMKRDGLIAYHKNRFTLR